MRTADTLELFLREVRHALPKLRAWRQALVRRDLDALERWHTQLEPTLQRLEQLRAQLQPPEDDSRREQALALMHELDWLLESAHEIILNELGYTHELMAMLVRASEPEHYAPLAERPAPNLLVNTEV